MRGAHAHAYHPWHSEFWLLLAILSNATGSTLVSTLLLPAPFSHFISALYMVCYHQYFHITSNDMPIAVDIFISLLCHKLIKRSWESALYGAFLANLALYHVCYFIPLVLEKYRLRNRLITFNDAIRPLSDLLWLRAAVALHLVQGLFVLCIWLNPFEGPLYWISQVYAGYSLVHGSFTFMRCFRVNDNANANRIRN